LQLSIIIVNYNVKYLLEQCLCSVQEAITNIEAEVFVIDNHSSDGSMDYLPSLFPWVTFIINEKNGGFAKANNQALQLVKGKYVLFLNPDTVVPGDCFTSCIRFFETTSLAGGVGIRMVDGSGKFLPESKRAFPTVHASFFKLTGFAGLFPRSKLFNQYALGQLNKLKNQEVDVLAGAFMMIRRKVLAKTGGFDESFFMYGEDVDLSYRIQKAGYKNYYLGENYIIHFKGESTPKNSLRQVWIFYKAMILFVQKYPDGHNKILIWLIQLAIYSKFLFSLLGRSLKLVYLGIPLPSWSIGKRFIHHK
jgi:GT2 family glycosyltransferase